MVKVALIETKPSRNKFTEFDFNFDHYYLCSDSAVKKVYKKHVDIDIDLSSYDWVVLVGSDAFKYFTKNNSVMEFAGKLVDDKFLPTINPAMLSFKPEARRTWEDSVESINGFVNGTAKASRIPRENYVGITQTKQAKKYIREALAHPNQYVALDSETSSLYCRSGHILGFSISYKLDHGAYISSDCVDEELESLMQELFNRKEVVFHNAKFDLAFFEYDFGFTFPRFHDTMLMHYLLDETPRTHGLKYLAVKHTIYGDYEKELHSWIDEYSKKHGILKADFTWDLIPFEVMWPYASMDAGVTLILFSMFYPALQKNKKLLSVYNTIMIPGTRFLTDIQENGVPFDVSRLRFSREVIDLKIKEAEATLMRLEPVKQFIAENGEFNPNSVLQLRKLLFDYIGLEPTGIKTGKGLPSTNAEVLEILAENNEVPAHILTLRKYGKIKNTYIDKILESLDSDNRLRTNFNLHMTTSGRLSSSGKLNMQQLPRDEPAVKGSIKAREGWKIVAMDLQTAEVYVAAVLSKDESLMEVFRQGGDFHGTVAHKVFKLKCDPSEVKNLFPDKRQAAKAITFGIMYGAGPNKIASEITKNTGMYCSPSEAKEYIDDYFREFKQLRKWIDKSSENIVNNSYVYSHFGRKRRLRNVTSSDRGVVGHEIRSGLNFLVQSVASDINLLGAIDTHAELKKRNMKAKIFALVHDSILAEVPDNEVEDYCAILTKYIQMDRGVSIPGKPINCDFDIGEDYSVDEDHKDGKFTEKYGSDFRNFELNILSGVQDTNLRIPE